MYPSDQFGVLFGMDDLPDELIFNLYVGTNLFGTYTAIKNATANGIYWWDLGGGDSRALRHEGDQWVLYTAEFPNEQPPSTSLGGQRCLIDDPEFNILPVFEDNFSDTYTVNTYDDVVSGPPAGTFTLTRQSLCVWTGFDAGYGGGLTVSLIYTANENVTLGGMWTIAGNGRVDGGPYKSPIGIYADGNYIWEVTE